MQYVGKLMRSADEEALREAVAAATLGSARKRWHCTRAERWRAELVARRRSAATLDDRAHPDTDSQQLRSLVRAARRDAAGPGARARQPKSFGAFSSSNPCCRGRPVPSPNARAHTTAQGPRTMSDFDLIRIGLVSISDRASNGVYPDQGIPACAIGCSVRCSTRSCGTSGSFPDEQGRSATRCANWWMTCLRSGADHRRHRPGPRDVTPEATLAVAHKVMPGFGEQMRQISLAFVPTAILSRQVAVVRGKALIINLPGQPKVDCRDAERPARRPHRRCAASSKRCPIAWT
jgi:molybdopterin adenylyltransferase